MIPKVFHTIKNYAFPIARFRASINDLTERETSFSVVTHEIIESSNIWRVMTGDRLVWVGKPRPGIESDNGILSIVTFNKNAIIIGEPFADYDGLPHFGGFDLKKQPKEDLLLCQMGYHAVSKLGTPRSIAAHYKWTIG